MPVWQTTYIVEKEEMSYKMPGRLLLRSRIWLKTVYNFLYIYISWTSKRRSNLQIFFKLFQYFEICYRKANLATALLTVLTLFLAPHYFEDVFKMSHLLLLLLPGENRVLYDQILKFKAAWKVSVSGVILVCIFLHWDWIRKDTPYLSVFSPNTRKIRNRISPNTDTFYVVQSE